MLYIGTPIYNLQSTSTYTESMFRLGIYCGSKGIDIKYLGPSSSSVSLGRNIICHEFIKDIKSDKLLFIDSDMGFDVLDVQKLLDFDDKDIIGFPYPHKVDEHFNFTKTDKPIRIGQLEPVEVECLGCGFMLVKKSTLENMKPTLATFTFNGESITQFFHSEIVDNISLSEDFWFCRKVRNSGMKIWIIPDWNLTHTGNFVFRSIINHRVRRNVG